MSKEFVICVAHFIRGQADSLEDAKQKMQTVMEEEVKKLNEQGFTQGQEWNARMRVNIGVFKKDHVSSVSGLKDTVSIEVGLEK